jgi:hypothetical protein
VTSEYAITITADTPQDAADIARRRANDDGYRVKTTKRVVRIRDRAYSVTLAVEAIR